MDMEEIMREVKRKIKKLFVLAMSTMLLMQNSIFVLAGTDGYTDGYTAQYQPEIKGNYGGELVFTNDSNSNIITYQTSPIAKPPSNVIHIYIGVVDPGRHPDVNFENNMYNEIKEIQSLGDSATEKVKALLQWEAYNNFIDNGSPTALELRSQLESMGIQKIRATKNDCSLASYVVDDPYQVYADSAIAIFAYDMDPIFYPENESYITVSQLKTQFAAGDTILKSGSIIFADYTLGTYATRNHPMFYVQNEGYVTLIGGALSGYEEELTTSFVGLLTNKLPDRYGGEDVEYWEIKSIKTSSEFHTEYNRDFFAYGKWIGEDDSSKKFDPVPSGYPVQYNAYIELEPVVEKPKAQNPTVSIDGYSLKLESNAPKNLDGTENTDMKADVVNYFYITTDTDKTKDAVKDLEQGGV